jgi:hypothetical protein
MDENKDVGHPGTLFFVMARIPDSDEYVLRFLKEAIAKDDSRRFQWMFYTFNPNEFGRDHIQFDGVPIFGLYPNVANNVQILLDNKTGKRHVIFTELSRFGKSLMELLQESGISSPNETIRETSKKVIHTIGSARHR